MKKLFGRGFLAVLVSVLLFACEKDIEQRMIVTPSSVPGFTSSVSSAVLTEAAQNNIAVTFKFSQPDYGVKAVPTFSLLFDVPSDTTGANAWGKAIEVKLPSDSTQKTYTVKDFNSLLVNQMKLATGAVSTIVVRLKSVINKTTGDVSSIKPVYSVLTMNVTPYKSEIIYPALMVIGGNSWKTPTDRTNGYVLTSVNFNNKYEGYIYLPNADGWGGDGFQLKSTTTGKVYGWGGSATTIAEGVTGNLWLTPAPNYMKVNVDLDANTVNFTPVQFYISGDDNAWSTSATPMTFDKTTNKWVANNVTLTPGKAFAFTANNGWDITYKVDSQGKLVFAGNPVWGGINITVPQKTGTYKITLDLSQGEGKYTYSIE